jgi:hypothetical protein
MSIHGLFVGASALELALVKTGGEGGPALFDIGCAAC